MLEVAVNAYPPDKSSPTRSQAQAIPAAALQPGFILGMGASCFVSVYNRETVLKGYEIWVNGKRQSYKSCPCEESVCWEELVYEHLGRHPRILSCYGLVEVCHAVHSLHLELAPLGNVRQYIEDHPKPLPEHTRLQMALDVAVGLGYVHSRKVQHADLSCRNLFLFDGFRTKLGDFGDSAIEGREFTPTVCEEIRCELPCRAREFHRRPIRKRELFALGSVIYEIMAWVRPYPGLQDKEVEALYAKEEFPSTDGIVVGHTIMNCWKEVYDTADQVVESLERAMATR